jgi:flagellar hook-associated protein 3 FlgL
MDASFTSTKSIIDSTRLSMQKLQNQLVKAQKEASSGRLADIGISLGAQSGRAVSMRREMSHLKMIVDTNGTASTRLDTAQATIENIGKLAQGFVSTLLAARSTSTGPAIVEGEAKANLNALIDGLNSSVSGEYLFAGVDVGTKPISNYFADTTSDAKAEVEAAFSEAFGSTQSDANNKTTITAETMGNFLADTARFHNSFLDPNDTSSLWSNWSTASSQNVKSRIATSETIETSSNANFSGYRKLAEAYTMVADLGVQNLNREAFQVVVDKAVDLVGQATQELAEEQGRLGTAQSRISNANDRLTVQTDILTTQINALETVDPYDAATRVNTLMTQMETAYSLTARLQKLSILNYL